jgi:hypothetical protein
MKAEDIERLRDIAQRLVDADKMVSAHMGDLDSDPAIRAGVECAAALLDVLSAGEPVTRQGRLVNAINDTPDHALDDVIRFFPEVRHRLLCALFRHTIAETKQGATP